jgi:hypothetical protein
VRTTITLAVVIAAALLIALALAGCVFDNAGTGSLRIYNYHTTAITRIRIFEGGSGNSPSGRIIFERGGLNITSGNSEVISGIPVGTWFVFISDAPTVGRGGVTITTGLLTTLNRTAHNNLDSGPGGW